MYKTNFFISFYALTPVHPGAGSSLSYVDLPVQRERHTGYPMMAGSGIKGVIRNLAQRSNLNDIKKVFGSEETGDTASLVSFTDAKILFYPVRSVRGVFAWVTCPYILSRLKKELQSFGKEIDLNDFDIKELADEKIIVNKESLLKVDNTKVALEEFVFDVGSDVGNKDLSNFFNLIKEYLTDEIKNNEFEKRLAIVSDNVFADLVNYAIEIRTRIKIDQISGTAKTGNLFTIEFVPSESIFYSFLFSRKDDDSVNLETLIENKIIQIGGDETTGSGFVKTKISSLNKDNNKQQA